MLIKLLLSLFEIIVIFLLPIMFSLQLTLDILELLVQIAPYQPSLIEQLFRSLLMNLNYRLLHILIRLINLADFVRRNMRVIFNFLFTFTL